MCNPASSEEPSASAHGDEGDLLVLLVSGHALGMRVEHQLVIHHEEVVVMPMIERNLRPPGPVGHAFHGVGGGVPIIEIAGDEYLAGMRSEANERDRFDKVLGRVADGLQWGIVASWAHRRCVMFGSRASNLWRQK